MIVMKKYVKTAKEKIKIMAITTNIQKNKRRRNSEDVDGFKRLKNKSNAQGCNCEAKIVNIQ